MCPRTIYQLNPNLRKWRDKFFGSRPRINELYMKNLETLTGLNCNSAGKLLNRHPN